jgi:hypothetical protein
VTETTLHFHLLRLLEAAVAVAHKLPGEHLTAEAAVQAVRAGLTRQMVGWARLVKALRAVFTQTNQGRVRLRLVAVVVASKLPEKTTMLLALPIILAAQMQAAVMGAQAWLVPFPALRLFMRKVAAVAAQLMDHQIGVEADGRAIQHLQHPGATGVVLTLHRSPVGAQLTEHLGHPIEVAAVVAVQVVLLKVTAATAALASSSFATQAHSAAQAAR